MCKCAVLNHIKYLGILSYNLNTECVKYRSELCCPLCQQNDSFFIHQEPSYPNINPYYYYECQACHQYGIYVLISPNLKWGKVKKEVYLINDIFVLKASSFSKSSIWWNSKYIEMPHFDFNKDNLEKKIKSYLAFL